MRTQERRRVSRVAAEGPIWLQVRAPQSKRIEGRLLDESAAGFRVRHTDRSLATGDEVEFSYSGRSGRARVVWTRILPEEAQSGFVVLDPAV